MLVACLPPILTITFIKNSHLQRIVAKTLTFGKFDKNVYPVIEGEPFQQGNIVTSPKLLLSLFAGL